MHQLKAIGIFSEFKFLRANVVLVHACNLNFLRILALERASVHAHRSVAYAIWTRACKHACRMNFWNFLWCSNGCACDDACLHFQRAHDVCGRARMHASNLEFSALEHACIYTHRFTTWHAAGFFFSNIARFPVLD